MLCDIIATDCAYKTTDTIQTPCRPDAARCTLCTLMETVRVASLNFCGFVYPIALCGDAIQVCTGVRGDVEIRWRAGDTASPAMADHDIRAFPAGAGDATRTKAELVSGFCGIVVVDVPM